MKGRFRFLTSLKDRLSVAAAKATQLLKPRAACLLLFLFGFAVHVPALPGPYISRDQTLIAGNLLIKSPLLLAENFRHFLFADGVSDHNRSSQTVAFLLSYI